VTGEQEFLDELAQPEDPAVVALREKQEKALAELLALAERFRAEGLATNVVLEAYHPKTDASHRDLTAEQICDHWRHGLIVGVQVYVRRPGWATL
jgi:hypothetical protein